MSLYRQMQSTPANDDEARRRAAASPTPACASNARCRHGGWAPVRTPSGAISRTWRCTACDLIETLTDEEVARQHEYMDANGGSLDGYRDLYGLP